MLRSLAILVFSIAFVAAAATYHVSVGGSNAPAGGSLSDPWATIDYAVSQLPRSGGDTILVGDGEYRGRTYITESFDAYIVIRAAHAYCAKLSNVQDGSEVFGVFTPGAARICLEGFVISNTHPTHVCSGRESNVAVHFQDATDIVFADNIVFGNNAPGTCNELLKINRGSDVYYPRDIHVTGNVFYDHADAGGADMIDAVRPGELDICENIFFARNAPQAQSFITLKREVPDSAIPASFRPARSPRYRVARNVFLNWNGASDQAFVQLGEDADAQPMITDALIENNLMIGNSSNPIAGAMQFKGARDVTVRANTVTGDLPGGSYGFRIGTEGSNPQSYGFHVRNNIWSDPTGTMGTRFINTYGDVDIGSFVVDNNLFYNAAASLPTGGSVLPSMDINRVEADPGLDTDHGGIVLSVWDEQSGRFLSGSASIREEFERLVHAYGSIPDTSPARGRADAVTMPADDILGRQRDASPDIGCFEYGAAGAVRGGRRVSRRPLTCRVTVLRVSTTDGVFVVSGAWHDAPSRVFDLTGRVYVRIASQPNREGR